MGLQNSGNSTLPFLQNLACYFNSLVQAYFMLPQFTEAITTFKLDMKVLQTIRAKIQQDGPYLVSLTFLAPGNGRPANLPASTWSPSCVVSSPT